MGRKKYVFARGKTNRRRGGVFKISQPLDTTGGKKGKVVGRGRKHVHQTSIKGNKGSEIPRGGNGQKNQG